MKILLIKKVSIVFAALLCITSVKAQIPDQLKSLPAFKLRASILSSLKKPHAPGKLNDMRCSNNALCLIAQNTLGGTGFDFTDKLIKTRDGGFIVCGGTNSGDGDFSVPVADGEDAYIAKYNRFRHLEWTKTFGGTGDDFFNDIAQTYDGGYIAAGYSTSADGDVSGNHGLYDVWVVKISNTGHMEWQKSLGGSGYDFDNSVVQTFDGGYAIAGSTNSTDGNVSGNHNTDGNFDAWLVKLGSKGNVLYQHCYGGSGFDEFGSMVNSDFGSLILGGSTQSNDGDVTGNHGGSDAWVIKINALGKIIWQKTVGGSNDESPSFTIPKTNDGNVVIDGYSNSPDGDINGQNDTVVSYIAKLNSATGNIIWSKSFAEPKYRNGQGVFATRDGGIVENGFSAVNAFDGSTYDVFVSKFDKNGNEEWYKKLGGSSFDGALSSGYESPDGSLNILCQTASTDGDVKNNHGGVDTWIIQLGRCGDNVSNENTSPAADAIAATKNNTINLSNYPNPVFNSTTISFSLPQSQKVSLQIFDRNGRVVKTLADAQMQAGNHQLTWNARDEKGNAVVAGIYLLKMQTGNYVETKKVSVIK